MFLKIVTNNNNISLLPATNVPNLCWSFLSIPAYDQSSVLDFVEIEKVFALQEAMCSYNKTQVSPCDPTKIAIYSILRPEDDLISNCGQKLKKFVTFDDIVHLIDKENIVTYENLDCALLSTLKLLQKSDRSTENGITFPDAVKNSTAFPVTINITVLLMSSITLICFWNRTVYGTWFQQLLCHSTTLMIDTLCPINTINQQLTNLEQTPIRCSLHCEGWTVK